tara:strand:+ start:172 stop:609 length:438 start_codon:yes stop_codon:yes gene_type:complete
MPEPEKNEIAEHVFYERLNTAPHAVRGFFESIASHFSGRNDVRVHHTGTNTADMRLAIPADVIGKGGRDRNIATMYWQPTKLIVSSRTYLTPEELKHFGFAEATVPKSDSEPLKSDLRLGEDVWRFGALDFIKVLEAAKFKMAPM